MVDGMTLYIDNLYIDAPVYSLCKEALLQLDLPSVMIWSL
jgi:hypothetical protein